MLDVPIICLLAILECEKKHRTYSSIERLHNFFQLPFGKPFAPHLRSLLVQLLLILSHDFVERVLGILGFSTLLAIGCQDSRVEFDDGLVLLPFHA